ncbi:hypothetical protein JYB62_18965 [Algoriphagus lutimaris]|uniref:hypothetical protein n=1 Tax=Algoriphagus lutimaris TaxID=613197 RepID=UPI00196A45CC|nr:hypothetical protein [Algoriphagus lutimaris]MBN3522093.1 hypothetical protein [Algoriphagus lutimaris]
MEIKKAKLLLAWLCRAKGIAHTRSHAAPPFANLLAVDFEPGLLIYRGLSSLLYNLLLLFMEIKKAKLLLAWLCREEGIAHTRSHAAPPLANLLAVDFEPGLLIYRGLSSLLYNLLLLFMEIKKAKLLLAWLCREEGIAHTRSHAAPPLANLLAVDFEPGLLIYRGLSSLLYNLLLLFMEIKKAKLLLAWLCREEGIRTLDTL